MLCGTLNHIHSIDMCNAQFVTVLQDFCLIKHSIDITSEQMNECTLFTNVELTTGRLAMSA